MITLKAKREIVSNRRDGKGNYITLAKKGDVLEFIADHDTILIVKKGNDRFHVRREDVDIVSN